MSFARLAARSSGFVLLAALLASVGVGRLGAALAAADPRWLALAAPGFLLFTLAKALRWSALLRIAGLRYPLTRSLSVYQASAFLAFVTPGRVGDLAKAAYLRRDLGSGWAAGVASTLADRALDLVTLALLAAGLVAAAPATPLRGPLVAGLVAIAAAAPALAWPPLQRGALRVAERIPGVRALAARARPFAERLAEELARVWSPWLLPLALLTAIGFLCLFFGAFALARALHLPIGFATTGTAVAAASVVALLPLSVSGIGTRDAALVVLLAPYGVERSAALSFSLAYLGCSLLFSNGLGAWLWLRDPLAPAAAAAAR